MLPRIAVFVSGGGSNLQALLDAEELGGEIVLVVSDQADAYALERAKAHGVVTAVVSRKEFPKRADRTEALLALMRKERIDWILLAGYLEILSADFTEPFAGRMLNIHPALLPKFGGKGYYGLRVHQAVLEAGEKETGATVHYVVAGCDEGPILLQESLDVIPGESPEALQKRVLEIEHRLYPKAVRLAMKGER